jgi:hypothetical protein
VRLYWAEPQEGEYGEMKPVVVGGRLGAAVYIRPDITSLGQDIAGPPRFVRGDFSRTSASSVTVDGSEHLAGGAESGRERALHRWRTFRFLAGK